MIEVKNLCKKYDDTTCALDQVSFSLNNGEICGLIGANGSGKTTLLRCMAGVCRPTSGSVELDSRNVYSDIDVHNEIAYMPADENRVLFETGNMKLRRLNHLYDHFSMDKFKLLNQDFHIDTSSFSDHTSKGQNRKLGIMLTLSKNGKLILLDEPEDGLDSESRHLFRKMLSSEMEAGNAAILFSSHDMDTVEKICDRIIMLKQGKVVLDCHVDFLMNQFQKWTVISELKKQIEQLPNFYFDKAMGCLNGFYSFGNVEQNERMLMQLSEKVTREKIHLKEIVLLMEQEAICPGGENT